MALLGSRRVKIGLLAAVLVLALPVYMASRRYVAVRAAETERLYDRAMTLLADQSSEPELRTALATWIGWSQTTQSRNCHPRAVGDLDPVV